MIRRLSAAGFGAINNSHARQAQGLSRRDIAISLIVSAVLPPILLLAAWKSKSFRQRHLLLTLFVGWYAMSLPIAYDPLGVGSDGVRHLLAVYVDADV